MNRKQNTPQRLPVWRDCQRLLLQIELAVRGFTRYHKYTVGSELRRQAMRVCQVLSRAIAAKNEQRIRRVQQLLDAVGDLKITVQLAKELKAFASFRAFGDISELTAAIGKQGGTWLCDIFLQIVPGQHPGPDKGRGSVSKSLCGDEARFN